MSKMSSHYHNHQNSGSPAFTKQSTFKNGRQSLEFNKSLKSKAEDPRDFKETSNFIIAENSISKIDQRPLLKES